MIYTSYFAKIPKLINAEIIPISIARWAPPWAGDVEKIEVLAPSAEILLQYKRDNDKVAYTKEYTKLLATLNPENLVQQIMRISSGNDAALCCYEKSGDFCHRHLIAKWLCDNGIDCQEWKSK